MDSSVLVGNEAVCTLRLCAHPGLPASHSLIHTQAPIHIPTGPHTHTLAHSHSFLLTHSHNRTLTHTPMQSYTFSHTHSRMSSYSHSQPRASYSHAHTLIVTTPLSHTPSSTYSRELNPWKQLCLARDSQRAVLEPT